MIALVARCYYLYQYMLAIGDGYAGNQPVVGVFAAFGGEGRGWSGASLALRCGALLKRCWLGK